MLDEHRTRVSFIVQEIRSRLPAFTATINHCEDSSDATRSVHQVVGPESLDDMKIVQDVVKRYLGPRDTWRITSDIKHDHMPTLIMTLVMFTEKRTLWDYGRLGLRYALYVTLLVLFVCTVLRTVHPGLATATAADVARWSYGICPAIVWDITITVHRLLVGIYAVFSAEFIRSPLLSLLRRGDMTHVQTSGTAGSTEHCSNSYFPYFC